MFDEGIRVDGRVIELVGIALTDEVRNDAAGLTRHVGHDVAPQIRRRRVAMQEHDRVPLTDVVVRHLLAGDGQELLAQGFDAHRYVLAPVATCGQPSPSPQCTGPSISHKAEEFAYR